MLCFIHHCLTAKYTPVTAAAGLLMELMEMEPALHRPQSCSISFAIRHAHLIVSDNGSCNDEKLSGLNRCVDNQQPQRVPRNLSNLGKLLHLSHCWMPCHVNWIMLTSHGCRFVVTSIVTLFLFCFSMGTRVFVGGLTYRVRERDLEKFFRKYGRIKEVAMKNGFAFVVSLMNVHNSAYKR